VQRLKEGRGCDLFRLSLYEAAALGANMSVPYGAWMGSVVQDAFYAPHELCVEIQSFLADHEHLYSPRTYADTAVVFSVESNVQLVARRDLFADNRANVSREGAIPFWQVCEEMSAAAQPYDVVFFPEGALRPDTLTAADLAQYRTLILPDCRFLTPAQADLLVAYLESGGSILAIGEPGANLRAQTRGAILQHERTVHIGTADGFRPADLPGGPQLRLEGQGAMALNVQRVEDGAAIHLIRYDYDESQDRVPVLPELAIDLRLPRRFTALTAYGPGRAPAATLAAAGEMHRLTLRDVPLYSVLLLTQMEEGEQP
jgi:hypothetical protein